MLPLCASDSELATQLQLAIDRSELALAYQPKIHLHSGKVSGVEALARWKAPDGEMVEPAIFIPIAERNGLIDALTDCVVRSALRQWAVWSDQGVKLNLAFNISALSLRDVYLPDYLHGLCIQENVPAQFVTVEVTEGATQHVVRLLDTLTRFRLKGLGVALDDFGTGYSSLLQLRQLPYTELKIDKCFVRDATASRESRLIIKAAIDLAHGFGLVATAEGVEDAATLALLRELGCDFAQGFLFAKPMEGRALVDWILHSGDKWQPGGGSKIELWEAAANDAALGRSA
jgi:EAL domain-containing protein (putative c-di-GMP-specific phosphodiesterase class I)